jgi:RNA polymerase sigma factor (TIGR02999 family)
MPERCDSHEDVTRWLRAWRGGDAAALEQLIPVVYGQLRRLARRELRRERADHSLQTADLVNELYMRLVEQRKAKWEDRVHFFAICSQLLRRILVDHARRRGSAKRAGAMLKVPLEAASLVVEERHAELIAVDRALEEYAKLDPRTLTPLPGPTRERPASLAVQLAGRDSATAAPPRR